MKKVFTAIWKAIKGFFVSLKDDFVESLKKHWLKLLGYCVSLIFPAIYLIVTYAEKKPESWALPVFVWLPVIIFVIVYWFKLRTYLAIKCETMQVENNIQKGKHAGALIICKTIQMAMTVIPFLICYYIFKSLAEVDVKIENIFLLLVITESVGGVLIVIDTIKNVVDYSDKEEPKQNTNQENTNNNNN